MQARKRRRGRVLELHVDHHDGVPSSFSRLTDHRRTGTQERSALLRMSVTGAGYLCGRSCLSSYSATSSTHTVPAASMTNRRSIWSESPVLRTSRYSRHPAAVFSTYVRFADCGSAVRNRGLGSACSTSAQNVAAYAVLGRSRVIRWESAAHWSSAFSPL